MPCGFQLIFAVKNEKVKMLLCRTEPYWPVEGCEISCAIDVSIQARASKSQSAVLWFIFQLFVKLPAVSQKTAVIRTASAPTQLNTITVI